MEVGAELGLTRIVRSGSPAKTHVRESLGQGACWFDHDRDGDLDLFVPNGARAVRAEYAPSPELLEPWSFYVNRGGRFVDEAARVGCDVRAWGLGCAVGDVDADGFDDLFVTTAAGPNRLLRNRGDGTFEDWTERSGVGAADLSASAAFGDLDSDGDLDLLVTTYLDESHPPPGPCHWKGTPVMCGPKGFPPGRSLLYVNDGRGVFAEQGGRRGLADLRGYGLGVVLLDVDGDGDRDAFVANDSTPNHLLVNDGRGRFEDRGLFAGVAFHASGATQASMGVDAGDLDGDGREDLVVTNFSDDSDSFYRNDGGGFFTDWAQRSGLAAASFSKLGWAVLLEDFDLDGDTDVFVANGHVYPQVDEHDPNTTYLQPPQLLLNDGKPRFTEHVDRMGPTFRTPIAARGAAAADYDGDGDVDLVVVRDGAAPLLLRNDLPVPGATWIRVRLNGPQGNPHGLGARVEIEAGGRTQAREVRGNRGYLSYAEPMLSFGLGGAGSVDRLTVRWPDGLVQVQRSLASKRTVDVRYER